MTDTSRKQRGLVVTDLGEKIKALRQERGLGQREFADKVWEEAGKPKGKVSHTQISEWERGTERPSVDKLIALAGLARTAEERAWFWAKAGVTEAMVRATFQELAANRIRLANASEVVQVPLSAGLSVDAGGSLLVNSDHSVSLPAEQFGSAPFLFCLRLDMDSGKGLFSPGDIAIIDRSPVEPQSFIDSLVLMFFERRYEYEGVALTSGQLSHLRSGGKYVTREEMDRYLELVRSRFSESFARRKRGFAAAAKRTKQFMEQPVAKLGTLRLEPAGGTGAAQIGEQISRFVLELGPGPGGYGPVVIPLTEWLKGVNPLDADVAAHIKRPSHIVGRVVGWLRQSGQFASEKD